MNWERTMSRLTRITGLILSIALMTQAAAGVPVWADDTAVSAETEEEISVQHLPTYQRAKKKSKATLI